MEYSPVACMRQSSRCCRSDSLGCLPRNFPLARAMAMPSRVRMRMRSASNSAKVARILKNSFPIGSPGSGAGRPDPAGRWNSARIRRGDRLPRPLDRRRRAPDRDAHRRGLRRCYADASRPAAYRGSRRRREPVRLVAPVRGGPELGRHQWPSRSSGIPAGLRSSLRSAGDRSSASHCPSSPPGGALLHRRVARYFGVIAVSPSSPSVPWSGAALSPMLWSRPMTGSSARPSGVRSGAAMRAFRIRGQYCAILWPPSGPLERRCSRQKGTARRLKRPSRLPAADISRWL